MPELVFSAPPLSPSTPASVASARRCQGCGHLEPRALPGRSDVALCPRCLLLQQVGPVDAGAAPDRSRPELAERLMRTRSLGSEHLVLDVGSGGGRRLRPYVDAEVPVLGIEPDRARARLAEDLGVPTTPAWFDAALGARLASEGRRGDVVHAHGVLDRVPDPFDFAQGLVHAVARDGVVVVEVPYVFGVGAPLPARPRYFSLTSLTTLLGAAGLFVVDVDVDGGQLLAEASPARPVAPPASDAVSALAFREAQLDPARVESYAPRFSPRPEGPGLQTPHPTAWSGAAPEGDPT